eukprot:11261931-Heterocapsa_arctica.AAC.1
MQQWAKFAQPPAPMDTTDTIGKRGPPSNLPIGRQVRGRPGRDDINGNNANNGRDIYRKFVSQIGKLNLANSYHIRLHQASLHHTVLVPTTLPAAVAMFDTGRRYYDEHTPAQPANAPITVPCLVPLTTMCGVHSSSASSRCLKPKRRRRIRTWAPRSSTISRSSSSMRVIRPALRSSSIRSTCAAS